MARIQRPMRSTHVGLAVLATSFEVDTLGAVTAPEGPIKVSASDPKSFRLHIDPSCQLIAHSIDASTAAGNPLFVAKTSDTVSNGERVIEFSVKAANFDPGTPDFSWADNTAALHASVALIVKTSNARP